MTTLTIDLPVEQFEKLEQLASRYQVAPEELVQLGIEELLTRPKEDFEQALTHVLQKNAELYRHAQFNRLASDSQIHSWPLMPIYESRS